MHAVLKAWCMCDHASNCIADLLVPSVVHEVRNEVAPEVEENAGCILACCIQHCRQDTADEGHRLHVSMDPCMSQGLLQQAKHFRCDAHLNTAASGTTSSKRSAGLQKASAWVLDSRDGGLSSRRLCSLSAPRRSLRNSRSALTVTPVHVLGGAMAAESVSKLLSRFEWTLRCLMCWPGMRC